MLMVVFFFTSVSCLIVRMGCSCHVALHQFYHWSVITRWHEAVHAKKQKLAVMLLCTFQMSTTSISRSNHERTKWGHCPDLLFWKTCRSRLNFWKVFQKIETLLDVTDLVEKSIDGTSSPTRHCGCSRRYNVCILSPKFYINWEAFPCQIILESAYDFNPTIWINVL